MKSILLKWGRFDPRREWITVDSHGVILEVQQGRGTKYLVGKSILGFESLTTGDQITLVDDEGHQPSLWIVVDINDHSNE